jgi:hypothetical protein
MSIKKKPPKKPPKKVKKVVPPAPRVAGRESDYSDEYARIAYNLCLLGATDADLSFSFEVSERTINTWKKKHPDFLQSITRAKEIADSEVARSLLERAKGFEWTEEVAIKVKAGKDQERVEVVTVKRMVPPDTQACVVWLTNRQRRNWKQRPEPAKPPGDPKAPPKKITFLMDRDIKKEENL